jgi:exonuclease SbcD
MAFRFLHAADLHLGSPLRGLSARDPALADLFDRASRRAFEALVRLAIDEKVDFVLIAGDVFDRDWKDWSVGQTFVREIARLTRAGIRVVMIRGNHDAESVISRDLPLPDGVAWLGSDRPETIELPEFGVAVHGMSFRQKAVTETMVHRYPAGRDGRFDIGLLHTSLNDRPAHDRYAPCSLADLAARGYDYWALGHIHAREEVADAGATVVFPGNLQGRSVRETGPKGATLVTVDGTRVTALEHRPVDAARWDVVDVDVTGLEAREALLATVRRALEDAATRADGRPLAARLRLVGTTMLADRLRADREILRQDLQATAAAVSDRIALEKLVVDAVTPLARAAALPLEDLDEALAAALSEPALAAAVEGDLATIAARMPAVAIPDLEPDRTRIIDAARALLLARLAGTD